MPTLLVGKRRDSSVGQAILPAAGFQPASSGNAGVTLLEMVVVVALIATIVAISFPAMSAGIETLRLTSAAQSIVSFINGGLNRAERRQVVVEVTVSKVDNALSLRSTEPGFDRKLDLPEGVKIESVLPEIPDEDPNAPRSFMLYPGGTAPAFAVALVNRKRAERIVRVDPITGVPQIETPPPENQPK